MPLSEKRCPGCKKEIILFPNTKWVQCICGWKWQDKWIAPNDQIVDLPTPSTQEAVGRFDKKFMDGNMNKVSLLLRDGNAYLMELIKAFLVKELSVAARKARKQALTEAIAIFDKYKDEPMTGNVVNLELKNLRGDYGYSPTQKGKHD